MPRDERYKNVKNLIESGNIKSFREIFDSKVIPKTVVAKDLGMHHQTFGKLLAHPEHLTYKDSFRIAALIDTDEKAIMNLIYNQYIEDKKGKRKR